MAMVNAKEKSDNGCVECKMFTIVRNIKPKLEDVLFSWKIIGHYRYFGPGG